MLNHLERVDQRIKGEDLKQDQNLNQSLSLSKNPKVKKLFKLKKVKTSKLTIKLSLINYKY